MSRFGAYWKCAVLAVGVMVVFVAPIAAEPTQVTQIKGAKLHLFADTGKRTGAIDAASVQTPLEIKEISPKGRFKVDIPGKGEFWILKAQTKTDEEIAVGKVVPCQSITKSYASSRGFGDCKKK